MTMIGTLRKNKPEVKEMSILPSLVVPTVYHGYHVPARNKTVILPSSHHATRAWERIEITNLKSSCTIMPRKVELTFWTSL
jgi:hypothetical protein